MERSDSLPLISPHFVSFAWRYHRSSPVRPHQLGTELWINLELVSRDSKPAVTTETAGSLRFPSDPRVPALFLDPGRTEVRQAIAAPRHGPRLCQQRWLPRAEDFGARSHGIGTRCLRFAMEVARHHARLASGCWPSFAGRDSLTRRVAMKGFRVQSLPPFSSLTDAMTPEFHGVGYETERRFTQGAVP